MAKLSEHLFELEPLKIEFSIDPAASRFQVNTYKLHVTSFSEMPKKQLEFLAKHSYISDKTPEKALADSKESTNIKMREKKANRKIIGSIEKIKQV